MDLFFSLITDFIFIYLIEGKKVIKSVCENNYQLHSDNFIEKIRELLSKKDCNNEYFDKNNYINNINNIFFLSGPGGQTGERVSLSFVTGVRLIKPNIKIFWLSSLRFQVGKKLDCLSVISVGEKTKKYFVEVYKEGLVVQKEKRIIKEEVDKIRDKFSKLNFVINFENINFLSNFFILSENFISYDKFYRLWEY